MSPTLYLGASPQGLRGEAVLFGVPFDGTASFRPGARFAPNAIREASQSIETYSPFLDRDLEGRDYLDWGDLELAPGSAGRMIEAVAGKVAEIIAGNKKPVILGGEHTVTLGALKVLAAKHPDLVVLHVDAHADFREDYLGEKLSHATVMRRAAEFISPDRIHRFGVRAGTREELVGSGVSLPIGFVGGLRDVESVLKAIPEKAPLYLTLDLDVFDPSLMPGVGNPEPDGLSYREFLALVRTLIWRDIVGFDVVELAPQYDPSGVSAIVAASTVRELMLCML